MACFCQWIGLKSQGAPKISDLVGWRHESSGWETIAKPLNLNNSIILGTLQCKLPNISHILKDSYLSSLVLDYSSAFPRVLCDLQHRPSAAYRAPRALLQAWQGALVLCRYESTICSNFLKRCRDRFAGRMLHRARPPALKVSRKGWFMLVHVASLIVMVDGFASLWRRFMMIRRSG